MATPSVSIVELTVPLMACWQILLPSLFLFSLKEIQHPRTLILVGEKENDGEGRGQ